jgi:hypothetical protein
VRGIFVAVWHLLVGGSPITNALGKKTKSASMADLAVEASTTAQRTGINCQHAVIVTGGTPMIINVGGRSLQM